LAFQNNAGVKELLKKLRKYEIRIRKAVNSQMQGDFRSVFKGSGLEFDDVRPYQYGDDIRTIDWNVSAKGHGTFVKTFREEKEQTIYFLLDVSGSQNIGLPGRTKADIGREICGVLALSAVKESGHVGLLCFSDQKEKHLKPGKGMIQAHAMISAMSHLRPRSARTDINRGLLIALNTIRRRSVIILISDFIDEGYEATLRALARKHDLVIIHISDKRETGLPRLGIVPIRDMESGKTLWVNTSFGRFRDTLDHSQANRKKQLLEFARRNEVNFVSVSTEADYVPQLLKLFKVRNKIRARG
jgi:uncharacterized protein (DUF58 family)